jgi:hypothetical protein
MDPERHEVVYERIAAYGLRALAAHDGEKLTLRHEGERAATVPGLTARRLTGLAMAMAEADQLGLESDQRDELREAQRRAMFVALGAERMLFRAWEAFAEAGIDAVVLKGPSMAHTIYPDPSWRPFGDIDLLVRTRDWRRACGLLAELGFARPLPEPRPGFSERFGKAATHRAKDGLELDLHRTLVVGPFGLWLQADELFEHTTPFNLGGRELRRLDDTALAVHACLNASLGQHPPLALSLRDVAQVVCNTNTDWAAVRGLAERWGVTAVCAHALRSAAKTLGFTLPEGAASAAVAKGQPRERRALRAYTTNRRRGGTAVANLQAIRGLRAKAAYVWALAVPSREFTKRLAAQDGGRSRLRRLVVPLRWATSSASPGARGGQRKRG